MVKQLSASPSFRWKFEGFPDFNFCCKLDDSFLTQHFSVLTWCQCIKQMCVLVLVKTSSLKSHWWELQRLAFLWLRLGRGFSSSSAVFVCGRGIEQGRCDPCPRYGTSWAPAEFWSIPHWVCFAVCESTADNQSKQKPVAQCYQTESILTT